MIVLLVIVCFVFVDWAFEFELIVLKPQNQPLDKMGKFQVVQLTLPDVNERICLELDNEALIFKSDLLPVGYFLYADTINLIWQEEAKVQRLKVIT